MGHLQLVWGDLMKRFYEKILEKNYNGIAILIISLMSGTGSGSIVDYLNSSDQKLWVIDYIQKHSPAEEVKFRLNECEETSKEIKEKAEKINLLLSQLHTSILLTNKDITEIRERLSNIKQTMKNTH
jgi:Uri superfamily endonuclease